MRDYHEPVLLEEVINYLDPKSGNIFLDCTLGGGGHTARVLERVLPDGIVIGMDWDSSAIAFAKERLSKYSLNLHLFQRNFTNAPEILSEMGIMAVDGIILDLGVSSYQISTADRGFSFDKDGPLDMRMDKRKTMSAKDLIMNIDDKELSRLLWNYGEEKMASKIAQDIIFNRENINNTFDVRRVIENICKNPIDARKTFKRVFQALRIAVNDELGNLEKFLDFMTDMLKIGGRAVFISFHSLEDRIVKNKFIQLAGKCICPPNFPVCVCNIQKRIEILTKKVVRPSEEEVQNNPMSKSARMRVCKRIA